MNLEKLKDTARKYEQKEDWRKALDVYLKAVQEIESGRESHPDLSLYNRIGDLYLKLNDAASAVRAYERAVDLYADQGFLNNAIALCGKLLRVNPGRTSTYLKLAQLHARKNVVYEAKRNLVEYIERMNATSQLDEAFAAVKEFADQFSTNQEIRLMLVELLRAASRNDEAVEQLERLAHDLEARGDKAGARKTRERLQALDSEPEEAVAPPPVAGRANDLIFLDTSLPGLTGNAPPAAARMTPAPPPPVPPPPAAPPAPAAPVEPIARTPASPQPERAAEPAPDAGDATLSHEVVVDGWDSDDVDQIDTAEDMPLVLDSLLEETHDALLDAGTPVETLGGLELTTFDPSPDADAPTASLDGLMVDEPLSTGSDIELDSVLPPELDAEAAPLEGLERVDDIELVEIPAGDDLLLADVELDSSDDSAAAAEPPTPLEFIDPGVEPAAESGVTSIDEDEFDREFADADDAPPASISEEEIFALEDKILDDPENPELHRRLAEALLVRGDRDRAIDEFDLALISYESQQQWNDALDVADQLVRLDENGVRFFQKRVELAYHIGDRPRLLDSYIDLGDLLVRAGAVDKALAVYRRVVEHDPENLRARNAIAGITGDEITPATAAEEPSAVAEPVAAPAPEASRDAELKGAREPDTAEPATADPVATEPAVAKRTVVPVDPPPVAKPPAPASPPPDSSRHPADFVDLGSMIFEPEGPRDTRMKTEHEQPTGDEQRDFDEMLQQFKKGIEQNLASDDYDAHYDLGVAFKEMGLLDEAIAEFQKALRAPEGRLRASEALGAAFFDKGQYAIAESVLRRAVDGLDGGDDAKIGLIYWLGRASEAQGKQAEAMASYQRALAVDIRFMDISDRMQRLAGGRPA